MHCLKDYKSALSLLILAIIIIYYNHLMEQDISPRRRGQLQHIKLHKKQKRVQCPIINHSDEIQKQLSQSDIKADSQGLQFQPFQNERFLSFQNNGENMCSPCYQSEECPNQLKNKQEQSTIRQTSLSKTDHLYIASKPVRNQPKKERKRKDLKITDPPSYSRANAIVTKGVEFVPVDQYFSQKYQTRVFEQQKTFYSATMSQSNLAKDDNKFYIVQILVINAEFFVFSRWGRVGVVGQIAENGPLDRKEAIRQYNSKTQSKIKNGGYKIVEMNYNHDQEIEESMNIDQFLNDSSKLPEEVQDLVRLIFDIKMMQTHMKEIGYDEKRSPLGLIAKSSIEKGYIALDKIMKVMKDQINCADSQKRKLLNEFSSQFYSAIPHDFGYMNMLAFVLNTEEKVKQKLEMLSSLSQIQIYSNLMKEKATNEQMSDVDIKYSKLKCEIAPLSENSDIHKAIISSINNTHAKTHDKYTMKVKGVYSLKREQEIQRYKAHLGNKRLLWHGSRLTNYVGILSEGLKIAPYEAPSTGYMFGKGIYFADVVSKSANYCYPKNNSSGLLLLCQVALGEMNDKFHADYTAHNLPLGKDSTRGVGQIQPKGGEQIEGVLFPNGQLVATGVEQTSLLYNEYVAYNKDQIQCRYIVYVQFHSKQ